MLFFYSTQTVSTSQTSELLHFLKNRVGRSISLLYTFGEFLAKSLKITHLNLLITSTLGFENVYIQSPRSSTYGGIQSFVAPSTSHAGVTQPSDSLAPANGSQSFTNFSTNANLMSSQPKAKLPKLALPKFRGEVTQWQNFGDCWRREPYKV